MPKPQRSKMEIESIKIGMLDQAVVLIAEQGYQGFSMRKLAKRLGIAAKTIYNYFHSKDELYLFILTKGFEKLCDLCVSARDTQTHPMLRIEAMALALMDFGLCEVNLYNLMFTWHVPKYNDYVGTPMESVAEEELKTALRVSELFIEAIQACADRRTPMDEEEARFIMIQFWTQMHGFLASINNKLLDYMHEDPLSLKDRLHENMLRRFEKDMDAWKKKRLTPVRDLAQRSARI